MFSCCIQGYEWSHKINHPRREHILIPCDPFAEPTEQGDGAAFKVHGSLLYIEETLDVSIRRKYLFLSVKRGEKSSELSG
jgi:hypothetical protein